MKLDFLDYKLTYEGPVFDPSYFLVDVWISKTVSIPIEFNRDFKADSYSAFFTHEEVQEIIDIARPWLLKARPDDSIRMIDLVLGELPKKPRPESLKKRVAKLEAEIKVLREIISQKLFVDFDKRLSEIDIDKEEND